MYDTYHILKKTCHYTLFNHTNTYFLLELELYECLNFVSEPETVQPKRSRKKPQRQTQLKETTKTAALTTASLSMWVKVSGNFGVHERQSLASNDDFNHGRDFIIADTPTTTNDAYIAMFAGGIIYGKTSASGGIPINDGNWHHLVWTYDGTAGTSASINMYVDGQNQYSNATYSSFWSYEIKFQYFGKPTSANTYFAGSMDEVAYFNSILSPSDVTAIYNSGVPNDLTSLNPVSWYRMGDSSTWDGSKWTLIDQGSGSNNAESVNMVEADRETDVPS